MNAHDNTPLYDRAITRARGAFANAIALPLYVSQLVAVCVCAGTLLVAPWGCDSGADSSRHSNTWYTCGDDKQEQMMDEIAQ